MLLPKYNPIFLYFFQTNEKKSDVRKMETYLSHDERTRAVRLQTREIKDAFLFTRGKLREILGGILKVNPAEIKFEYGEHGKPSLVQSSGEIKLKFNLSHSRNLAVIAVAWDRELGIDLEWVRDVPRQDKIVEKYFSEEENRHYQKTPMEKRSEYFFNCWTAKEAYVKAMALSLLPTLHTSIFPENNSTEALKWCFYRFKPDPNSICTLAYENKGIEPDIIFKSGS